MSASRPVNRRRFLALLAALPVGVLAACGGAAPPQASSPAASAAAATKPAASAKAVASPQAGGSQPTLKVAYPVVTGAQTPLWLAETLGFFTQQGVKVQSQYVQADIAAKAVVARDIDVVLQSASPILTADLNGSAGLVYVASEFNHAQSALLVPASITSPAELKGKVWGTDKPGTATDYYSRLLMQMVGLMPSDVQYRVLGNNDVIVTDLLAGQVQAGAISPPLSFKAEAAGFHALKDTYDAAYQNVGVVVLQARIPELTPALMPFLVAYRKGIEAFYQQPQAAKQILRDYAKITDPVALDKSYDFYVNKTPFQRDLEPSLPGIQQMLDFLAPTLPAAKTAKPEQFVDRRLLDRLPKA